MGVSVVIVTEVSINDSRLRNPPSVGSWHVVVLICPFTVTDSNRKHGHKEKDYAWKAETDTDRHCHPNLTLFFELGTTRQADCGLAPVFP